MKKIISIYRCGHTHTTVFPRGCSKREETLIHETVKHKQCNKCAKDEPGKGTSITGHDKDSALKIVYQSPDYNPKAITNRYLHIDLQTGKPIVSETIKTQRTNHTYRSCELPKDTHEQYKRVIAKAEKIKCCFPYEVEFTLASPLD